MTRASHPTGKKGRADEAAKRGGIAHGSSAHTLAPLDSVQRGAEPRAGKVGGGANETLATAARWLSSAGESSGVDMLKRTLKPECV